MKRLTIWIILTLFLPNVSFSPVPVQPPGKVRIEITHYAGEAILKLDSAVYKNGLGQEFKVTKFKYYIGNIVFKQPGGKDFTSGTHYLVDEEDPSSKNIVLEVPDGNYTTLEFIIGVDSLHNCSGAQSGALDPVNAMFWTWNTGYIFMKLEGRAASSSSPGHFFEYHIGGYKDQNNCIRKVVLPLKSPIGNASVVRLNANVLEILKNPTPVDFSRLSSVTAIPNSMMIADNYADIFTIAGHNE